MSLRPEPIGAIPAETTRVARAAFRKGTVVMRLRDEFGALYEDEGFRELYPTRGQPGLAPWRLALVTVFRFLEHLSDRQAADAVRARIGLLGVDFDNDSAFMNETVVGWCRQCGLEVTRSRACRKNDQAFVEQKNGAIVRRLVGHGRLEGLASAAALPRLYAAARLHGNLFQPSFKLRCKTRIGARVIKRYHPPEPPLARVLAHPAIAGTAKERLQALRATCDPILLLGESRLAQAELGERVDRRGTTPSPGKPVGDLAPFIAHLGTAWREGERRPTHRRPYRRVKPFPKRPEMLDPVREQLHAWMDERPDLSAIEALARLQLLHPGRFTDRHLRTVQRALKLRRSILARQIVL